MKQKIVLALLNEAISENDSLFLVDITISTNNKINIIVDGDEGVNLKECIRINRFIEDSLDREDEDYSLEVGSPDIVAPLKHKRQYNKNIGRILKVKTETEKFEGTLIAVEDDFISLEWKAREPKPIGKGKITVTKNVTVSFEEITVAKVKIIF